MIPLRKPLFWNKNIITTPTPVLNLLANPERCIAAYSTDKLRRAYNGPCMAVQRITDLATANIPFEDNSFSYRAYNSFAAGSSMQNYTWYDQSGNNNHAAYPSFGWSNNLFIFNNKINVFFSGGFWQTSNINIPNTSSVGVYIAAVVGHVDSPFSPSIPNCNSGTNIVTLRSQTTPSTSTVLIRPDLINYATSTWAMRSFSNGTIIGQSPVFSYDTPTQYSSSFSGGTNVIRVMGVAESSVSFNFNIANPVKIEIHDTIEASVGIVNEILIFSPDLSTSDRNILESNQMSRLSKLFW